MLAYNHSKSDGYRKAVDQDNEPIYQRLNLLRFSTCDRTIVMIGDVVPSTSRIASSVLVPTLGLRRIR